MKELFVVDQTDSARIRRLLEENLRVVQEMAPRMLVVEGAPEDVKAAASLPGVSSIRELSPTRDSLSAGEKLFADAWAQNEGQDKPDRPFEGLNWGAKGLSAP